MVDYRVISSFSEMVAKLQMTPSSALQNIKVQTQTLTHIWSNNKQ